MTQSLLRIAVAATLIWGGQAAAQDTAPIVPRDAAQSTPQSAIPPAPDCPAPATMAEAATQPDPSEDATAPENSSTTGWSGGTGGSFQGTNLQGAVESSPTWQPPTARGLDLAGLAEPVPTC